MRGGAKEREAVGVVGARGAVGGDGGARAGEVRPGRFAGHEAAGNDLAGVVIKGEQEDGFARSGPPVVRGGVVLPEFADGAGLPAAAGLGAGLGHRRGEGGQMQAAPCGDGGARAVKIKAARDFIGEQGEVERAAVREELDGELGAVLGPRRGMIATTGQRAKGGRIF